MEVKSTEITLVHPSELTPHPKNCHIHTDAQIERLCHLIEYQGFRNPLIVQKGTNLIVAGHGRLQAANKLGMQEVPVIYEEFKSEEQLYAYLVSDNAIGKDDWAKLDLAKVNEDFLDLGPDIDIDMLGIESFTIEPPGITLDDASHQDERPPKLALQIDFKNEMDRDDTYDDLISKGHMVKKL